MAFTVRLTVLDAVSPWDDPLMLNEPTAAEVPASVLTVNEVVFETPACMVVGLKTQVAPVGKPVQARFTVPVKPLAGVTVTVTAELVWPAVTVTDPGAGAMVKL